MMKNRILICAFSLIILITALSILAGCTAVTYRVVDGDTIKIQSGEYVRYLGIDTPEKGEPLFIEAANLNRSLLSEGVVGFECDVTDKDIYGRLLRYVYAGDILVNLELVRSGLALAYARDRFKDNKYYFMFAEACDVAYQDKLGIWSLDYIHPKLEEDQDDYYIPPEYFDMYDR
jgi:endonuclease YncB( thermonuclease family)